MKFLTPILLLLLIGCSDKTAQLKQKDIQYQRFLHYKADKELKEELRNYDEN